MRWEAAPAIACLGPGRKDVFSESHRNEASPDVLSERHLLFSPSSLRRTIGPPAKENNQHASIPMSSYVRIPRSLDDGRGQTLGELPALLDTPTVSSEGRWGQEAQE